MGKRKRQEEPGIAHDTAKSGESKRHKKRKKSSSHYSSNREPLLVSNSTPGIDSRQALHKATSAPKHVPKPPSTPSGNSATLAVPREYVATLPQDPSTTMVAAAKDHLRSPDQVAKTVSTVPPTPEGLNRSARRRWRRRHRRHEKLSNDRNPDSSVVPEQAISTSEAATEPQLMQSSREVRKIKKNILSFRTLCSTNLMPAPNQKWRATFEAEVRSSPVHSSQISSNDLIESAKRQDHQEGHFYPTKNVTHTSSVQGQRPISADSIVFRFHLPMRKPKSVPTFSAVEDVQRAFEKFTDYLTEGNSDESSESESKNEDEGEDKNEEEDEGIASEVEPSRSVAQNDQPINAQDHAELSSPPNAGPYECVFDPTPKMANIQSSPLVESFGSLEETGQPSPSKSVLEDFNTQELSQMVREISDDVFGSTSPSLGGRNAVNNFELPSLELTSPGRSASRLTRSMSKSSQADRLVQLDISAIKNGNEIKAPVLLDQAVHLGCQPISPSQEEYPPKRKMTGTTSKHFSPQKQPQSKKAVVHYIDKAENGHAAQPDNTIGPDTVVENDDSQQCTVMIPPRPPQNKEQLPTLSSPPCAPIDSYGDSIEMDYTNDSMIIPSDVFADDEGTPKPAPEPRRKRKGTGRISEYFKPAKPVLDPAIIDRVDFYNTTGKKKCIPGISSAPVPSITSAHFGIIQEKLWREPFWLLIALTFLNVTSGRAAAPVFWTLKARYPTAEALSSAEQQDLYELIYPLGLHTTRSKRIISMAKAWLVAPPIKGRRTRTLHYPCQGDGRAYLPSQILETDDPDCAGALEIAHLPGCKTYAYDSWRIFCRDVLRGVATDFNGQDAVDENFEPEWKRVLPLDKELRACLRWMWLREGWIWEPLTGERRQATEEEIESARRGEMELADPQERKFAAQAAWAEMEEELGSMSGDGDREVNVEVERSDRSELPTKRSGSMPEIEDNEATPRARTRRSSEALHRLRSSSPIVLVGSSPEHGNDNTDDAKPPPPENSSRENESGGDWCPSNVEKASAIRSRMRKPTKPKSKKETPVRTPRERVRKPPKQKSSPTIEPRAANNTPTQARDKSGRWVKGRKDANANTASSAPTIVPDSQDLGSILSPSSDEEEVEMADSSHDLPVKEERSACSIM